MHTTQNLPKKGFLGNDTLTRNLAILRCYTHAFFATLLFRSL